jgi:hypothetical protein
MQVGAYAGSSLASHPAEEGYHPWLTKPRGGGALTVVEQDGLTQKKARQPILPSLRASNPQSDTPRRAR